MADELASEENEANKNQNEQSSADALESDTEHVDKTPQNIDFDDERNVIDIDGNFTLEDLIKRASILGKKPKDKPAAETAPEPTVIVSDSSEEIAALKAQVELEKNNTLRALADLQNLRRRSDDERLRIIKDGNERLIKEILPVLDDFERGLAAARTAQSYEQLINGVESVLRKLDDTLRKQGVEAIPAVGEPFNPDLHEAVSVQESEDQPDETILQELRKGYTLHGRVIRPSLVTVAKS